MILLKPQDIVILLKLGLQREPATLATLGAQLGISASEIHAAMNRAAAAMLLDLGRRQPRVRNLLEFLEHGIRYVFIPRRGEITRGIPTAHSAPPLKDLIVSGNIRKMFPTLNDSAQEPGLAVQAFAADLPMVWPHPEGEVRGESCEPLYPSAVDAARRDGKLHECLALVDALRVGRAREKNLAIDLLSKRLRAP